MLKPVQTDEPALAVQEDFVPVAHAEMLAVADNSRCLAKSCGCFACSDRCDAGAVTVVPGQGIRIDADRCIGCGTCEYVCPVTPKAIFMKERRITAQI